MGCEALVLSIHLAGGGAVSCSPTSCPSVCRAWDNANKCVARALRKIRKRPYQIDTRQETGLWPMTQATGGHHQNERQNSNVSRCLTLTKKISSHSQRQDISYLGLYISKGVAASSRRTRRTPLTLAHDFTCILLPAPTILRFIHSLKHSPVNY